MNSSSVASLLCGLTEAHLDRTLPFALHGEVLTPLRQLQAAGREAGFEIQVASSYRSFASQLNIWNAKVEGRRPVLNDVGVAIDPQSISPEQLAHAILRWSALPGLSRHHWGTEFDVFDSNSVGKDYRLQLIPAEYVNEGPFAPLNRWLGENLATFGFFRPYSTDRGGVSPEPWHISYAPISEVLWKSHSVTILRHALKETHLALGDWVEDHLEEIFARYFRAVDHFALAVRKGS